jgi:hypothetical protein
MYLNCRFTVHDMKMPGFTADASFYNTTNLYSGATSKKTMNLIIPAGVCCVCSNRTSPGATDIIICRGSCCPGIIEF